MKSNGIKVGKLNKRRGERILGIIFSNVLLCVVESRISVSLPSPLEQTNGAIEIRQATSGRGFLWRKNNHLSVPSWMGRGKTPQNRDLIDETMRKPFGSVCFSCGFFKGPLKCGMKYVINLPFYKGLDCYVLSTKRIQELINKYRISSYRVFRAFKNSKGGKEKVI